MYIIAMGDIPRNTREVVAIAELASGRRLTVTIINPALSKYLQ